MPKAANTLQLFNFIRADLLSHRPKPPVQEDNPFAEDTSFNPLAEPRFPKSLYLLDPLFTAYQLNPVAAVAQSSVPIPEGLDLDAWIVPPPPEPVLEVEKKKKSRKGKEKEKDTGGKRPRSVKQNTFDAFEERIEPEEDEVDLERVTDLSSLELIHTHIRPAQGRAPRTSQGRSILYHGYNIFSTTCRGLGRGLDSSCTTRRHAISSR